MSKIIKKISFLILLILTGSNFFYAEPISIAIATMIVVANVAPLVKNGSDYFFPTVHQRIHLMEIEEELKFIKARDDFRECLFNSDPKSKRNYFNCPLHCAEMSRAFIACSRKDEMIEMIKNFDLL